MKKIKRTVKLYLGAIDLEKGQDVVLERPAKNGVSFNLVRRDIEL